MEINNKKPPEALNIIEVMFKNGRVKIYRVKNSKNIVECHLNALEKGRDMFFTARDIENDMDTIVNASEIVTLSYK